MNQPQRIRWCQRHGRRIEACPGEFCQGVDAVVVLLDDDGIKREAAAQALEDFLFCWDYETGTGLTVEKVERIAQGADVIWRAALGIEGVTYEPAGRVDMC